MQPKLVFFDQDNTIFKTKEAGAKAYAAVFKFIADVSGVSDGEVETVWRDIVEQVKTSKTPELRSVEYSFGQTLEILELDFGLIEPILQTYKFALGLHLELVKGAADFFAKPTKFKKVLFTEDFSEISDLKLNRFKLRNKFDLRLTSDIVGVMKPDMKYLEIAWQRFEVDPTDCFYIGDNWAKDCELGQKYGGKGIVIGSQDDRADFCVENFGVISNILAGSAS